MTQQVVRSRTTLISTTNNLDNANLDLVFEATGSNPNLDFAATVNPLSVLQAFFNATQPDSSQVSFGIAGEISRAAGATMTSWTDITAHLDGSPAGSPFRTDNWTLGTGVTGSTLPLDASIVCSYRADYGSAPEKGAFAELPTPDDAIDYGAPATHTGQTRPRARMRGRFYLGPLNSARVLGTSGLVLPSWINNTISPALDALLSNHNIGLANQFEVRIWSRRDATTYDPTHYFVSEAFGTVRRRGDVSFPRVHAWQAITDVGP